MSSDRCQIKLKLDVPPEVVEYFQLEQQWENEGGATPRDTRTDLEYDIQVPLQSGVCYVVKEGRFEIEGDELIYIAVVHPDHSG